jgi:uncharacterized protein
VELTGPFFALAIPVVLFAGVSKGGFGSGAAFLGSMVLALILEPVFAVGLMLPLLMLMDVESVRNYWRKWKWDRVRFLMIGAVPGVLLGMLVFRSVNADGIRLLVGLISIAFVVYQVTRSLGYITVGKAFATRGWGLSLGGAAGFTSFVSHAGGPPAAMYLIGSNLTKTEYQASTVLVFWWINLIKCPAYLALGLFTKETMLADLLLAPVALAGVWLGVRAHRFVPERLFFNFTYTLLVLTGLKLIHDALT